MKCIMNKCEMKINSFNIINFFIVNIQHKYSLQYKYRLVNCGILLLIKIIYIYNKIYIYIYIITADILTIYFPNLSYNQLTNLP